MYTLHFNSSKCAAGVVLSLIQYHTYTRVIAICNNKLVSGEMWYPILDRERIEIPDTGVIRLFDLHFDRIFSSHIVPAILRSTLTQP
jgi:hypothetical protein